MWQQSFLLLLLLKTWRQHLQLALYPPFAQLEQMCQKQKPSLAEAETAAAQKENIQTILGLVEPWSQAEEATSPLKALHLLAGAMNGEEVMLNIASGQILKTHTQKKSYQRFLKMAF